MKFTVILTPLADLQLAEIWLAANDRQAVADASDRINASLRNDAGQQGRLRSDGRRVILHAPLSITFEVDEADRKATIVSIIYKPVA